VFGGVKIINKVAPAFLIPVLFSLLCIYLGVFIAPRHNAPSKYRVAYKLDNHHYAFMCSIVMSVFLPRGDHRVESNLTQRQLGFRISTYKQCWSS
jgi:hypothetical protein